MPINHLETNANRLYLLITSFRSVNQVGNSFQNGGLVSVMRRTGAMGNLSEEDSLMSVTNPTQDATDDRDSPPEFDLKYRFDDADNPAEVTVFPAKDCADVTTEWITIAESDALTIEDIR